MSVKKILSLLLVFVFALGLLPVSAFAANFSDTDGHWAEAAIDRWSGYGVVNGVGDGRFDPDGTMTRAQAAQVFTKLLGLSGTAGAMTFSDVPENAWYADAVAKVTAAGIMNGVGNGLMNPDGNVTREQFFVMFARALGLAERSTTSGPRADGASWSAGYINALTDKGYVKGDGNGVNALANINRASVMSLLDQTIRQYVNASGTTALTAADGVILVVAKNVTLTGTTAADVVIAQGAADGTVAFEKATVTGAITAQAANVKITSDKDSKLTTPVIHGANTTYTPEKAAATTGGSSGGGGGSSSGGGGGSTSEKAPTSVTITAKDPSDQPISSGAELTVFRNEVITLTAAQSGGTGEITYIWSKNGTEVQSGTENTYKVVNASAAADVAHSYTVKAKNNVGEKESAEFTFTVTVLEKPTTLYSISSVSDVDHTKYTDNVFAYDANENKIAANDTVTPIARYEITGPITLSSEIADNDLFLSNITFTDTVTVEGGGSSSIHLENVTVPAMSVNKQSTSGTGIAPRIHTTGTTTIEKLKVEPGSVGAILEDETDTGAFSDVTAGADITVQGATTLDSLTIDGGAATVKVDGAASVGEIEVTSTASADIADGTGTVSAVSAAGDVTINTEVPSVTATGSNTVTVGATGAVKTVMADGQNVTVKTLEGATIENPVEAAKGTVNMESPLPVKITGSATVDVASGVNLPAVTTTVDGAKITGKGTVESLEATNPITVEANVTTLTASAAVTLNNGATVTKLETASASAAVTSSDGTGKIEDVNATENVSLGNVSVTKAVTVPEGSKATVSLTGTTSVKEVKAEGEATVAGATTATVTTLTATSSAVTVSGGTIETVAVNNKNTTTTVKVNGGAIGTVNAESGVAIEGSSGTVANVNANTGSVTVSAAVVSKVTTTENSADIAVTGGSESKKLEIELGAEKAVNIEADNKDAVECTSSVSQATATVNGAAATVEKKTPMPTVTFKDSKTILVETKVANGTIKVNDTAVSVESWDGKTATVTLSDAVTDGGTVTVTYDQDGNENEYLKSNPATSNKWVALKAGTQSIPAGYLGDETEYKIFLTGSASNDQAQSGIYILDGVSGGTGNYVATLTGNSEYVASNNVVTFTRKDLKAETPETKLTFTITDGDTAKTSATATVTIGASTKGVSTAPESAVFTTDESSKAVTSAKTLTVKGKFLDGGTLKVYDADGAELQASGTATVAGDTATVTLESAPTGNVSVTYTSPIGTESAKTISSGYAALTMKAIDDQSTTGAIKEVKASVTGGAAPYTYSVSALPEGLTHNNGTISGTPSTNGSYQVTLTVTDGAKLTASRTFTIVKASEEIKPASVTVTNAAGAKLNIGETLTLSATVAPSWAANRNVTWTSENPSVAKVAETSGEVTGVAPGTARITATAVADETVTATYTVEVLKDSYAVTASGPSSYAFTVGSVSATELTFGAAVTNNGKAVKDAKADYTVAYYADEAYKTELKTAPTGFTLNGSVLSVGTSADWGTSTSANDTIYAKVTATANDASGDAKLTITRTKAQMKAPEELIGVAPTAAKGSDGKIDGFTSGMEYATRADAEEWTAYSSAAKFAAGVYYVRTAATTDGENGSGKRASEAVAVIVPAYTAKLTLEAKPSVIYLPTSKSESSISTVTATLMENGVQSQKAPTRWSAAVTYINGKKLDNNGITIDGNTESTYGVTFAANGGTGTLTLQGKAGEILHSKLGVSPTSALIKITATYENGEEYTSYVSVSVGTRYTLQTAIDAAEALDENQLVTLDYNDGKYNATVGNTEPTEVYAIGDSVKLTSAKLTVTEAAMKQLLQESTAQTLTLTGGEMYVGEAPVFVQNQVSDAKAGYYVLKNVDLTYTVGGSVVSCAFNAASGATAQAPATVTVVNDVTNLCGSVPVAITVGKDVTLNVNGSLTVDKTASLTGSGKLMLTNKDATITAQDGSSLTVESGVEDYTVYDTTSGDAKTWSLAPQAAPNDLTYAITYIPKTGAQKKTATTATIDDMYVGGKTTDIKVTAKDANTTVPVWNGTAFEQVLISKLKEAKVKLAVTKDDGTVVNGDYGVLNVNDKDVTVTFDTDHEHDNEAGVAGTFKFFLYNGTLDNTITDSAPTSSAFFTLTVADDSNYTVIVTAQKSQTDESAVTVNVDTQVTPIKATGLSVGNVTTKIEITGGTSNPLYAKLIAENAYIYASYSVDGTANAIVTPFGEVVRDETSGKLTITPVVGAGRAGYPGTATLFIGTKNAENQMMTKDNMLVEIDVKSAPATLTYEVTANGQKQPVSDNKLTLPQGSKTTEIKVTANEAGAMVPVYTDSKFVATQINALSNAHVAIVSNGKVAYPQFGELSVVGTTATITLDGHYGDAGAVGTFQFILTTENLEAEDTLEVKDADVLFTLTVEGTTLNSVLSTDGVQEVTLSKNGSSYVATTDGGFQYTGLTVDSTVNVPAGVKLVIADESTYADLTNTVTVNAGGELYVGEQPIFVNTPPETPTNLSGTYLVSGSVEINLSNSAVTFKDNTKADVYGWNPNYAMTVAQGATVAVQLPIAFNNTITVNGTLEQGGNNAYIKFAENNAALTVEEGGALIGYGKFLTNADGSENSETSNAKGKLVVEYGGKWFVIDDDTAEESSKKLSGGEYLVGSEAVHAGMTFGSFTVTETESTNWLPVYRMTDSGAMFTQAINRDNAGSATSRGIITLDGSFNLNGFKPNSGLAYDRTNRFGISKQTLIVAKNATVTVPEDTYCVIGKGLGGGSSSPAKVMIEGTLNVNGTLAQGDENAEINFANDSKLNLTETGVLLFYSGALTGTDNGELTAVPGAKWFVPDDGSLNTDKNLTNGEYILGGDGAITDSVNIAGYSISGAETFKPVYAMGEGATFTQEINRNSGENADSRGTITLTGRFTLNGANGVGNFASYTSRFGIKYQTLKLVGATVIIPTGTNCKIGKSLDGGSEGAAALNIDDSSTVTVEDGALLDICEKATLTVEGTLAVNGTIANNGVLYNLGSMTQSKNLPNDPSSTNDSYSGTGLYIAVGTKTASSRSELTSAVTTASQAAWNAIGYNRPGYSGSIGAYQESAHQTQVTAAMWYVVSYGAEGGFTVAGKYDGKYYTLHSTSDGHGVLGVQACDYNQDPARIISQDAAWSVEAFNKLTEVEVLSGEQSLNSANALTGTLLATVALEAVSVSSN